MSDLLTIENTVTRVTVEGESPTAYHVATPGPQGPTGATGADGADGTPGSMWYEGSGVPGGGLGVETDLFLDTATGNVYQKQSGLWTLIANIRGPQGPAGPGGAPAGFEPIALILHTVPWGGSIPTFTGSTEGLVNAERTNAAPFDLRPMNTAEYDPEGIFDPVTHKFTLSDAEYWLEGWGGSFNAVFTQTMVARDANATEARFGSNERCSETPADTKHSSINRYMDRTGLADAAFGFYQAGWRGAMGEERAGLWSPISENVLASLTIYRKTA